MQKDWLFASDEHICDVRATGVLIQNDRLLVQREIGGSEYALPGGHVQIGETLEDALVREFAEEIGEEIHCKKMLWSEECFWTWNGRKAHNFTFYYLIESSLRPNDNFTPHKDGGNVEYGWLPLKELDVVTIYPSFLKQQIHCLDDPIQHFVTKDA